jgi:zinc finger SWIM domain-containing protein 3
MSLVLFVGVNHHGQSIIIACSLATSLVAREDNDTYIWVFSNFIQCMGNIKPGGILTDQCGRITNGIEKKLSGILHRFCVWHITHKLPSKWSGREDKEVLTKNVKKVVYTSLASDVFEQRWAQVMLDIGYQNDSWFIFLYSIRTKWISAFLNHRFWAGMTTTQRVENMNNFMNKFLRKKSTLANFIVDFDETLLRLFER